MYIIPSNFIAFIINRFCYYCPDTAARYGNSQEFVPALWCHWPPATAPLCVHIPHLYAVPQSLFKLLHPCTALSVAMTETAPLPQERSGVPVISPAYSALKYLQGENKMPLQNQKNSCCTTVPCMQFGSIPPCHRPQYWHFTSNFFKFIEIFLFKHF